MREGAGLDIKLNQGEKEFAMGWMAERSKARAWKVRIRHKRIVGSNPTPSDVPKSKPILPRLICLYFTGKMPNEPPRVSHRLPLPNRMAPL